MKQGDTILVYNVENTSCYHEREFIRMDDNFYVCQALEGNKAGLTEVRWSYLYEVKK